MQINLIRGRNVMLSLFAVDQFAERELVTLKSAAIQETH